MAIISLIKSIMILYIILNIKFNKKDGQRIIKEYRIKFDENSWHRRILYNLNLRKKLRKSIELK